MSNPYGMYSIAAFGTEMPIEIGLISDTHGFMDPNVCEIFADVDEIWHAGDFGDLKVVQFLMDMGKTVRGVFGNIDTEELREHFPKDLIFEIEGLTIWMTHIAGRPGRYEKRVKSRLQTEPPDVLVCGHSHILLVERDKKLGGMLYLNPGAAGHHGFHQKRTLLKCTIESGNVKNLRVIDLGPRGRRNAIQN